MTALMLEFYILRPDDLNFKVDNSNRKMHNAVIQKLKAYKLIEPTGFQQFNKATERGYEAYYMGGFDKWKAANDQREKELHKATIDSSKATVDAAESAKWSKYAAIVSAIAAIIAFALPPLLNDKEGSQSDSLVNALHVKVDMLYSQLRVQSQSQKAKGETEQSQKKK